MAISHPDDVTIAVTDIANFILVYAAALASVGTLTMALIEAYKSVFHTRDNFHRRSIQEWIGSYRPPSNIAEATKSSKKIARDNPATQAFETSDWIYFQLMQLTTGTTADNVIRNGVHSAKQRERTRDKALFILELDKMMGQIQDAADIALSSPELYPELYYFLTSGASSEDIKLWYAEASRARPEIPEGVVLSKSPTDPYENRRQETKNLADAYGRLNRFIRHRLDAFQLVTGYHWSEWNQWIAIALGAVLLFGVLIWDQYAEIAALTGIKWLSQLVEIAVASLFGGVLAPVAKDLMVALKKVRAGA